MTVQKNSLNLYYDLKIYSLIKKFLHDHSGLFINQDLAMIILLRRTTSNYNEVFIEKTKVASLHENYGNFLEFLSESEIYQSITFQIEGLNRDRDQNIADAYLGSSQYRVGIFNHIDINNDDLINHLLLKHFSKLTPQKKEILKTLLINILTLDSDEVSIESVLNNEDRAFYNMLMEELGRIDDENSIFHQVQLIFHRNLILESSDESTVSIATNQNKNEQMLNSISPISSVIDVEIGFSGAEGSSSNDINSSMLTLQDENIQTPEAISPIDSNSDEEDSYYPELNLLAMSLAIHSIESSTNSSISNTPPNTPALGGTITDPYSSIVGGLMALEGCS